MVGALFFCLGVFAGGVHLYRRFAVKGGVSSKRRLVVRERLTLSSKSSLTLVSLDGKEFVVASGSEHVTLIPTNTITANSFSEALSEETELEGVFNA
jgi:flagellar biogenesis protein FliO